MNLKERKAIIAGNWKLNKRVSEIPAFTQELQANLPAERCCDVVICAPYPLIAALETAGQGCHLGVGAQDVSEHQHGAFTGEVSAEQLSDLGAQYCIVGHSERRSYHGETDLQVNAKTKILLANSITPIICVGESLAQREHDLTETYVAYQVAAAFSGLTAEQAMHCVIAYEPLWAIGTGNTATSAQAQEVCASIRATLGKLYDLETAQTISILYGGSMNAGNAAELLAQPDVDGVRPYLIEVQALVSGAAYGTPQRSTTGYDTKRMNMLLAVLEKRVGMKMFQKDVFLNFAGGFKVADPGLDLAVVAAVISSYYDRPVAEGVCCAGEIGLSGEVRPAPRTEQRISEAARLGFKRIVVSGYLGKGAKRPKGIEVVTINSVDQLPRALFVE